MNASRDSEAHRHQWARGAARHDGTIGFDFSTRRVEMLFNVGAGSGVARAMAIRLRRALEAFGAVVPDVEHAPDRLDRQVEQIRTTAPDVVVAIGGDGTVNTAARLARRHEALLLVIPAGTMNLVARDLRMPTDIDAIIEDLGHLTARRIDCATVNDHLFLHSSLLGVIPKIAEIREASRERLSILQAVRRLLAVTGMPQETRLHCRSDAGTREHRTTSLAVTCNPIRNDREGSHRRQSLSSGTLGVYASKHRGPLRTARVLMSHLSATPRHDDQLDASVCRHLDVDAEATEMLLANDGELVRVLLPLEYRIHPRGLRVLVPEQVWLDP